MRNLLIDCVTIALRTAAILIGTTAFAVALEPQTVPGRNWSKCKSPTEAGWSVEKLQVARKFSESIDTAALMIIQDGIIVDEWGPTALPLMCHSVRKSLLSALYGPHVASGNIDLDQTLRQLGINDNAPSLSDIERQAKIRDLLKARSGVYHPALYETAKMAAARPERGSHEPGSFWYYNNWDFNAACAIFENLTGRSIFEEFEDQLAIPLEMEDFSRSKHTKYFTGEDSVHPAYPFEMSTRDLARVGLLYLRKGRWGNRQIVSEDWVRESTHSYSDTQESGGYGYMWWVANDGRHFPEVSIPDGSFSARGVGGQYLLVLPEWNLVICHRVNTFESEKAVSKSDFGKLLALIFDARPISRPVFLGPNAFSNSPALREGVREKFDTIIRNGEVVDGTGKERFRADVAITGNKIAEIGTDLGDAAHHIVDAQGKLIAPGFVDLHSHAEDGLIAINAARRSAPNLITQGITTVVVNQDGRGPMDLAEQKKAMRHLGIGVHVVQMLGHGTLRESVMGKDYQRPANADEIQKMQAYLATTLNEGAFGLSAGLEYVPGRWSTPHEMESLAKVVAAANGAYIVHERSSGSRPMWYLPSRDASDQPSMLDNLRELIFIADRTKVTTVATHIKARGTDFWGSAPAMIALIDTARSEGLSFFADQYPYNTSGSDGNIVLIPTWARPSLQGKSYATGKEPNIAIDYTSQLERFLADESNVSDLRRDIDYEITRRGGGEGISIIEHLDRTLIGYTLASYATKLNTDLVEAVIQLQLQGDRNRPGGARLRAFSMSESDIEAFAQTPWTATSSDAGIVLPSDGPVHPRHYGAFPRKIRHYAIDQSLMTIEEAIRVSTSLPASILTILDRGIVQVGAFADLIVLDPKRIRDKADAYHSHQYSEGIDFVFVNGKLAVDEQRWLGSLNGEVLKR